MNNNRFKILVVWCLLISVNSQVDNDKEEYYWRHFDGTIPHDAVPGGVDELDRVNFIGQTIHNGALVPGDLQPRIGRLIYEDGGPQSAADNLRILCSKHPEYFEWLKVTKKSYQFLWPKHIVIGGHHTDGTLSYLIGRAFHQNRAKIVGKVHSDAKDTVVYYNVNGTLQYQVGDIELLSYNPPTHLSGNGCGGNGKGINVFFNN